MRTKGDTIAAIATHEAPSALGIVRISGPLAGRVLETVVPKARATQRARHIVMATARDPESTEPLDQVICFFCRGPKTATGEDTAEIHGHGGRLVMQRLLQATIKAGARPAEPGEFTYRAFVNGKIDLTQAEAIMGLIGARSSRAARLALVQLSGSLGKTFDSEEAEINAIAAQLEAGLDFPEEDLPVCEVSLLESRLREVEARLDKLKDSFVLGTSLRNGARVAIVGPPNAGKSSLLNALANEERAIVDSEPGTTRDVVEAETEIAGIPITISDTAGLRGEAGRVELVGMERSRLTAESADVVIVVLDGTLRERKLSERLQNLLLSISREPLIALNKKDLAEWNYNSIPPEIAHFSVVPVSALKSFGVDKLKEQISRRLNENKFDEGSVITTARQYDATSNILKYVKRSIDILAESREPELAAMELRWAREEISKLTGRSSTDEMLNALFSTFCVGK